MSINNICQSIQDNLISLEPEQLNQELKDEIRLHLDTCKGCREFYQALLYGYHNFKQESSELPKPHPDTKQNLINYMKESKSQKQESNPNIWQKINDLLFKPIPAYQAIIAVMLVVLFFNITWQDDFIPEKQESAVKTATQIMIRSDIYNISDLDFLNEQKIGVNAREDTLLSSLLYITM